ncbi:MAG: GNAT family N-acetyltransferase [Candidatus Heimdallarchaeota archaeon]|nr:GNAT family N-acetyltransferase [Candidatus Heimdallarchaeota archaeon]
MDIPTISSKRLLIRPVREDEIETLQLLSLMPEINQNTLIILSCTEEARMYYQSRCVSPFFDRFLVGIEFNSKLIGTISILDWDRNHRTCEIGYQLHPDYWSKGIMTEALRAILPFIFYDMGINRLEASCNTGNIGSQKVLEKTGFVREGIMRQKYYFDHQYKDEIMYSLLAEDYTC